jgi:hypothetical protein
MTLLLLLLLLLSASGGNISCLMSLTLEAK